MIDRECYLRAGRISMTVDTEIIRDALNHADRIHRRIMNETSSRYVMAEYDVTPSCRHNVTEHDLASEHAKRSRALPT